MPNSDPGERLLSEDVDGVLQFALREWRNARVLLANAIKTYQNAGATLHDTYIRSSKRSTIEEALSAIDSELGSLELEERVLLDTRVTLATIRNKSARLAHINTLPHEVLAIIFAMSKTFCVHDAKHCLHNLTGVCAHWRQIAERRVELWTHIDVGPKTASGLTSLLLERTKEAPIHVHLHEPKYNQSGTVVVPGSEISRVVNMLTPHMHRVSTLDLESHNYSRAYVHKILELWLKHGSPSLAKSLLVYRPQAKKVLLASEVGRYKIIHSQSVNGKAILESVTTLHLQNVQFDWNSSAWRGLVDLRLSSTCDFISISTPQLAEILSANPNLATLKIKRLGITSPDDWEPPAPIELTRLKVLNLSLADSNDFQHFLRLITLPSFEPDLVVGLTISDSDTGSHVIDFFTRCRVRMKTLHLSGKSSSYDHCLSLMKLLPLCDELVLHILKMSDSVPMSEAVPDSESIGSEPAVHLPCVTLFLCTVTLDGLKKLVAEFGVQDLVLEQCTLLAGIDGAKDLEAVRMSLLETYHELKCTVLHTFSDRQMLYNDIFDRCVL